MNCRQNWSVKQKLAAPKSLSSQPKVPVLAAELLDKAARESATSEDTRYDSSRLREFLADMAQFSDRIPDLPDEALSRESIYCDHN